MKRFLSLLLCLALLLGTVLCFASCGKKTVELDIAGYTLVYAEDMTGALLDPVEDMQGIIKKLVGKAPSMGRDTGVVETYEILIGNVDRPEVEELRSKIKEDGYAYGVVENKVVIVGTTKLLTLQAAWAFMDACLSGEGSVLSITETVVSNVEMVELMTTYNVIYSDDWDDTKNEGERQNPTWQGENPDALDYGVVAARQIRLALRNAISAPSNAYEMTTDAKELNPCEVLVGLVDRDATDSFIKRLDVDNYGIGVMGDKLVVTGLNDTGLRAAIKLFEEFTKFAVEETEDGTKYFWVPADFSWIRTMSTGWKIDVPRPEGEGIDLMGSTPLGEGAFQFQYEGSGVNEAAYLAYCEKLVAEGYKLTQDNTAEGSIFRAYEHSDKYIRVYAIYAAYSHAAEQKVSVHVPTIRLVTSSTSGSGNRFDGVLTPDYAGYEKVTETKLTAVRLGYKEDGSVYGNCYVVQLEDGSFFIQDGGFTGSKDYERLWAVLKDLYYQAFGRQPSAAKPVVVAAWYLSHGHGDHYGNFVEMCKRYGDKISAEYLIANMPSDEETYNCYDPNLTVRNNMNAISTYTKTTMTYLKVQTGQRLYLRNMEIEVLYTHGDIYPRTAERFNNTSTVLRTTLHSTDGEGNLQGDGTTVLWLGDLQTRGSMCMRAMYGDYLDSDIVQVAHHGGSGVELGLYQLAAPEIVLWPHSVKGVNNSCNNVNASVGSSRYVSSNLYHLVDSVQYHVISDFYNTTITITKDGPVMTLGGLYGLYNAGETAEIVIGENNAFGYAVVKK